MNDSYNNNTPVPDSPPPFSAEEQPPKPARRFNPLSKVKWIVLALILSAIVANSLELFNVSTWYRAAAIEHLASGDKEQALASAEKSIEWSPENAGLRVWYAEFFCELEEYDKAEEQIIKSYELAPEKMRMRMLMNKASFLLRLGKHEQALGFANEVVEACRKGSNMHLHEALNGRGYLIAQAREDNYLEADLEQGLKDIEEAIGIYGNEPNYLDTRGYLKYFNGDLDGAFRDIDRPIKILELLLKETLDAHADSKLHSSADDSQITFLKTQLSILYHHRAVVLEKQGKTEAAEKDAQLSKEYGFNRMKGIW